MRAIMLGIRMKLSFVSPAHLDFFNLLRPQQTAFSGDAAAKALRIRQNYRATLPRLTCDESIVSQTSRREGAKGDE